MTAATRTAATRVASAARRLQHRSEHRIYRRHADASMVSRGRYVDNLLLASRVVDIPGAVVECGCWRGGMSAGIAEVLGTSREYVLLDSFEGLPPVSERDGPAAAAWQSDTTSPRYRDNCRASEHEARQAMERAGAAARLIKGWFDQTIPQFAAEAPAIALLRLDADWYDSTIVCLEHLYELVVPGGVVIIDDYGTWDGCTRAVHDYLSRRQVPDDIRTSRLRVPYLIRRPSPDLVKG